MKRIVFACCTAAVFLFQPAQAQQKAGRVVYERTVQINFSFTGMDEGMQRMIPRSRTDKLEVLFGDNQSLRKSVFEVQPEENNFEGNGVQIRMVAAGADDITYTNFSDNRVVEQRELATKKYIVTGDVQKLNWKLTGETKTVLNIPCQQAISQRISTRTSMVMEDGKMKREEVPDTLNITAWFAPSIPVSAGPEYQGQLPGLILAIDINNGRTVYKAIELSPAVEMKDIKEPKNGKKMTQEEFTREREKVLEEMQQNNRGNRTIRINSN